MGKRTKPCPTFIWFSYVSDIRPFDISSRARRSRSLPGFLLKFCLCSHIRAIFILYAHVRFIYNHVHVYARYFIYSPDWFENVIDILISILWLIWWTIYSSYLWTFYTSSKSTNSAGFPLFSIYARNPPRVVYGENEKQLISGRENTIKNLTKCVLSSWNFMMKYEHI